MTGVALLDLLPPAMRPPIAPFVPLCSRRAWCHAQALLVGAILAPGIRTVAALPRVMGLSRCRRFPRYPRALNRAVWSGRAGSRVRRGLLVATFAPPGPLVLGIDDTLERRWGTKIAAQGGDRDAVRSSKAFVVEGSGLRWVCLMVLVPLPWAKRVWALPFLTGLAPSERAHQERGPRPAKLTDRARQRLLWVGRWLPDRDLVGATDSSYAVLDLLARCTRLHRPITVVTRLRPDAALDEPAPPRAPGRRGRPRRPGKRLPTLASRLADPPTVWPIVTVPNGYGEGPRTVESVSETAVWYPGGLPPVPLRGLRSRDPDGGFDPRALLCTDPTAGPAQGLERFVPRWQMAVPRAEVRRHLGVEAQRQWAEAALRRTTPALLGLFSLVTLLAHPPRLADPPPVRQAAWYPKHDPTFADALAPVRRAPWAHHATLCMSRREADMENVPRALIERLTHALGYAAQWGKASLYYSST